MKHIYAHFLIGTDIKQYKGPLPPWMAAAAAARPADHVDWDQLPHLDKKLPVRVELVLVELLDTGRLSQVYLEALREMHGKLDNLDVPEFKKERK